MQDVRVSAITRIWGLTVGIIAVSIPISITSGTGAVIPLAAIGGATVSTVAVWRSDDKKSKNKYLQHPVELLEQRISNLETIIGRDDVDLRMKIQQLESNDHIS